MVSFSTFDLVVICLFALITLLIGFLSTRKSMADNEDYLLAGRKVALIPFILINVSTWYGGILGVGEFTYRYGLLSWFTQGLPYYIFAILFAVFLVPKIRGGSIFTIPEKIYKEFGTALSLWSALLVFILVTPAPYLLMIANIIDLVFNTGIFVALIIGAVISIVYLFFGGFRANVWVDSFLFFIMFGGFILTLFLLVDNYGGLTFLTNNLPPSHLKLTGDASPMFIIVWFIIAIWTFTDPGFHQRTSSASSIKVAKWGIIISVVFWGGFDFLTTSIGLFSRALLPDLVNPVLSYPLLAEKVLTDGIKGIFYIAMFATILSTLNSFFFLSATTISFDFLAKLLKSGNMGKFNLRIMTSIGLVLSAALSVLLAYFVPSVIQIWYSVGSIFIPSLLIIIMTAYFQQIRISKLWLFGESLISALISLILFLVGFQGEPMLIGLGTVALLHLIGLIIYRQKKYC